MLGYMTNCVQNFQELPNGILNWLHCFTFSAIYENSTFSVSLPVLLLCFLIQEILVGLKHYPIVVLICNFLTTNDIESIFMGFFAIYIYSLVQCLSRFACFLLDCLIFLLLGFQSFLK